MSCRFLGACAASVILLLVFLIVGCDGGASLSATSPRNDGKVAVPSQEIILVDDLVDDSGYATSRTLFT